jgi:hypothetical protein
LRQVLLCSSGQAGLKLSILLPQLPTCWGHTCVPPC